MAANPQYAEGEVIANKYVVEALLGESPAARTFLANGSTGKLAVKFYRPEVSARLLAAPDFFLKAGVMTEIEHDNLSVCLDVQEEMGLVFIARAYADGQSFEDWVRKHRADGNYFPRGLEILWQACQGLAGMHERTRHLNIHPGNVIVGSPVAKLCDWDPRALGNMEMTPDPLPGRSEYQGYRAPEAAGRNGFLSYPSTDLFAVAGMLYRLVKGEHPSVNPAQTLGEVRAFDKDLAVFLGKAMHPKPEERFQDAGAFSDALWELGGAMGRLQERNARSAPAPRPVAEPVARKAEPLFPDPPADGGFAAMPGPAMAPAAASGPAAAGKEPTLFGSAKPAVGNDTFFNFFPPAEAAPASPAQNKYQAPEPKPSGDTLFGAPSFPNPGPQFADPPRSGLSELETPGTLFGSTAPLFSAPKPAYRNDPPPPAPSKPIPVSLSSLEKDPLEMAGSGEPGGFTAYGFKGAGDSNRTGIYTPEAKAAAAKTKLMILLGTAGALILLLALGGLFLYLRGTAARKTEPVAETVPEGPSPRPIEAAPQAGTPQAAPDPASAPQPETRPVPAEAAPAAHASASDQSYSDPPMPVEPPSPGAGGDAARPQTHAQPKTAANPGPAAMAPKAAYQGNIHVTPERETALMAMVQTRTWPASAAECLKAADELNDLGKTAEANVTYSKVLVAAGVNDKQRILAFGGLAVTFQSMGMKDQARDAVRQILAINPKNGFALKLKEKLR